MPTQVIPAEIQERIDLARQSANLTDCARSVLDILAGRFPIVGCNNAMQIAHIQRVWMQREERVYSDRLVKEAVKSLIEDHGIAIGSSRRAGSSGYFVCATPEDLAAAERPLRAEVFSLLRRLKTFNPNSDISRHLAGQVELSQ